MTDAKAKRPARWKRLRPWPSAYGGSQGRAGAVATVDRPVLVEEERAPGLVIVELEQAQIDIIDRDDAHTDELVLERLQFIARTNNLFVNILGGCSGDAAEHDEQWLAGGPGLGVPFFQVIVNPVLADVGVIEVSLQFRLGMKPWARRKDRPKYERNGEFGVHSLLPKKEIQMANERLMCYLLNSSVFGA